jgi:hypothetical protein
LILVLPIKGKVKTYEMEDPPDIICFQKLENALIMSSLGAIGF